MPVENALTERINTIIDYCAGLTNEQDRAKALTALNHAIFLLTGTRPKTFVDSDSGTWNNGKVIETTRTDKRGCVSCKERMLKAMKKE